MNQNEMSTGAAEPSILIGASSRYRAVRGQSLASSARALGVTLLAQAFALASTSLLAQTSGPGSLDTTFNGTGQAVSYFSAFAVDGALDSQERIVVTGYTRDPLGRFIAPDRAVSLVARFNFNGTSLDRGFGDLNSDLGTVLTDFGPEETFAKASAFDSAGRIVVVGRRFLPGDGPALFISRYTTQGVADATFVGVDAPIGSRVLGFNGDFEDAKTVAIDTNDAIVVAGGSLQRSSIFTVGDDDFALARILPNGENDNSFDGDGRVLTDLGGSEEVEKVLLDQAGRIVAVGDSRVDDGSRRIAIARYLDDGRLDVTFSGDGKLFASFGLDGSLVYDAALDSTGRILVAGKAIFDAGGGFLALARFNQDGSRDLSFGPGGVTLTDIRAEDAVASIAFDASGRIIAAGTSTRRPFDNSIVVTRYSADGVLDQTFGLAGVVLTDVALDGGQAQDSRGVRVKIDSANRIVVAGTASTNSLSAPTRVALIRYNNGSTTTGNTAQVVQTLRTAGAIASDGLANALTQQLSTAQAYTDSGQLVDARNVLGAFINLVDAQRSKKKIAATTTIDGFTLDPAAVLVSHARGLIATISDAP